MHNFEIQFEDDLTDEDLHELLYALFHGSAESIIEYAAGNGNNVVDLLSHMSRVSMELAAYLACLNNIKREAFLQIACGHHQKASLAVLKQTDVKGNA